MSFQKKELLFVGLLVIGIFTVSSTSIDAKIIKLYAEDSASLVGMPVNIQISYGNTSYSYNILVDENSSIYSDETQGHLTARIRLDNIYVGHFILESNDNYMILRKTAKISGFVTDEQDNMLQHIKLRIICSALTQSNMPEETDELGFFSIDEVGFGSCDIGVLKDNKIITHHQIINESKQYVIQIQTQTEQKKTSIVPFVLGLLIIVVVLALFVRLNKKQTKASKPIASNPIKPAKEQDNQTSQKDFSNRQKDLMNTLSEKEQNVLTLLFFEGELTQSQLRYKTGFPKSSLHRTLTRLEQKNLALCRESDGLKKFELSEFFLG